MKTAVKDERPGARACAVAMAAAAVLSLCACGDLAQDEVEGVGASFAAAESDPVARCQLLAPSTRATLAEEESSTCEEAIGAVPLGAGEVTSAQVWGEEAQVRLTDDTLFLTRTSDGWRITAAACEPQGDDEPYHCQLEAS